MATDEAGLEAFFAAARQQNDAPSEALMTAILGDALAAQPARRGLPMAASPAPRRWAMRDLWQGLGGWQTAAVLGVSLAIGGVLGYTPPSALEPLTAGVLDGTGMLQSADYYMLDDMLAEG
ncbi:MAG: hypothetical protein K8F59_09180 [Rhodobacteraceae bacterium]|nr:hypothetical protein [Paracoccaceae bacterium]